MRRTERMKSRWFQKVRATERETGREVDEPEYERAAKLSEEPPASLAAAFFGVATVLALSQGRRS